MEGEFVGGCDILLQMHQSGELGTHTIQICILNFILRKCSKTRGGFRGGGRAPPDLFAPPCAPPWLLTSSYKII